MTNRTVSVALKLLIGDYVPNADKAADSTDKIGQAATRSGEQYKKGSQAIVTGATVAATAGTLAIGKIISANMDFGKSMSNVQAVSGATGDQLKALSDAAIKAGADTAFSATQAADAEAELAKAGVSTSDILGGGLSGALSLAAAGQLDLGNAATIAANAMNIFGLKGSDVGHIADVLAAGANKSAADVDQLAQAMSQGGQVASSLGLGLEDTVGVLSMFADAGLKGSDAGTSLKTMLQALAAPSSQAAAMMKQLGLNAFDASGNFVGMEKFAGQLQDRLGGLTQEQRANALATIFGADAVRVANVLFKEGSAGVREYTTAVNDQGAAAKNAATQQDNLAGDLEKLSGSIDTALIKSGSGANSVLRKIVQTGGAAVDVFTELPGPVQATGTALLVLGTGATAAIAAFGVIAPKVRSARTELESMGRVGSIANRAVGLSARAIGASIPVLGLAAAGIEIYNQRKQEGAARVQSFTDAIIADSGAIGENTRATVTAALQQKGALDAARQFHLNLQDVTDAALGNQDALTRVNHVLDTYKAATSEAASAGDVNNATTHDTDQAYTKLRDTLGDTTGEVSKAAQAARNQADAMGKSGTATAEAGDKTGSAVQPTQDMTDAQKAAAAAAGQLTQAMIGQTSASSVLAGALDLISGNSTAVVSSQIAFKNSLAALTEAHKQNGAAVSQSTQKGRDNASAILSAMEAARQNAEAVTKQAEAEGKGAAAVTLGTAAYDKSVTAIRRAAAAAGLNKKQVDALIASVYKTPAQRGTTYSAPGAKQSKADIDAHNTAASKTPKTKSTQVSAPGADTAAGKMNRVTQLANGIPEHETTMVSAPGADTAAGKMSAAARAANGIPASKHTTVTVSVSGVAAVQRQIDSITGHVVQISVGKIGGAGSVLGRASGGPVEEGRLYRVNESGAEGYFVPPKSGVIVNHADLQSITSLGPAIDGRTTMPAGPSGDRSMLAALGRLEKVLASRPPAPLVQADTIQLQDPVSVDLLGQKLAFLESVSGEGTFG